MGGDIVAGTNMVEALELFEHDDDTEGIILAGEVGGRAELDAAEWIKEYKQRSSNPKYDTIEYHRKYIEANVRLDQLLL